MILDGQHIELGDVIISDSKAVINKVEIPINCITIDSKDKKYSFTFWTQKEFHEFNKFPLNEKIDIIDMIDNYDIDFSIESQFSLNTRENTKIYFTRIDDHKYIFNTIINDLDVGINNYKTLELEVVIDFIKDHK